MKKSLWDISIFKKYSSVSHYRLLSQLLTELKAYPINRSKESKDINSNKITEKLGTEKESSTTIMSDSMDKDKPIKNLYSNIDTI